MTIAIGLGGNLGGEAAIVERFRHVREALAQLGAVRSARLYRTAPIGPVQAMFLNSAVSVSAPDATPAELFATLRELESLLGRDRTREVRNGPRAIDLDVLSWDARVIRTPDLEVPHPRLAERRFAIAPLVDLYGEAFVVGGATLGELARRVATQVIEDLGVW